MYENPMFKDQKQGTRASDVTAEKRQEHEEQKLARARQMAADRGRKKPTQAAKDNNGPKKGLNDLEDSEMTLDDASTSLERDKKTDI